MSGAISENTARPYSAAGKGPSSLRRWIKAGIIASAFALLCAAFAFAFYDVLPRPVRWFAAEIMGWQLMLAEFVRLLVVEGADQTRLDEGLVPSQAAFSVTTGLLSLVLAQGVLMFGRGALIDRLLPEPPDILDYVLFSESHDPDHPQYAARALHGRGEEMKRLRRFAGRASGEPAKWITLAGGHGLGKSKLGLEWLAELQELGWDAGVLRVRNVESIRRARFRHKTAIVIDEALSLDDRLRWEILDALLSGKGRIRVLLIDQLPVVLPKDSALDRPMRERIEKGRLDELEEDFSNCLMPLGEEDLRRIAPEALSEKTFADAEGRPLYVLLGDDPARTISTRVKQRLEIAQRPEEQKLLAFAALASPVEIAAIPHDLTRDVGINARKRIFRDARHAYSDGLPPLPPHPFADSIFLAWAGNVDARDRKALMDQAITANGEAVQVRLRSLWTSLVPLDDDEAGIRQELQDAFDELRPDLVAATRAEAERLGDRIRALVEERKIAPDAETVLQIFDQAEVCIWQLAELSLGRGHDREMQLHFATGVQNFMLIAVNSTKVAEAEFWGNRLVAVTQSPLWYDDEDIQMQDVTAARWMMHVHGEQAAFDYVERWGARILAITQDPRWHGSALGVLQANVSSCAMHHYGDADLFADVERWAAHLDAIVKDALREHDLESRQLEARAAARAITSYGRAGLFADAERWGERLVSVSQDARWRTHPEFGASQASGASGAMRAYAEARRFDDMERWGDILFAVSRDSLWHDNLPIQIDTLAGSTFAITIYAKTERFADLERWGKRLIAVAADPAWRDELGIQHEAAVGITNAIVGYANRQRIEEMEHWIEHLLTLTGNPLFRENVDIQGLIAAAAIAIVIPYNERGRTEDAAIWEQRLLAIVQDSLWHDNPNIQLQAARAANNGIVYGARSGDLEAAARWRHLLAETARRFPDHPEISFFATQNGVGVVDQFMFDSESPPEAHAGGAGSRT